MSSRKRFLLLLVLCRGSIGRIGVVVERRQSSHDLQSGIYEETSDIDEWDDNTAREHCRFDKATIRRLVELLEIETVEYPAEPKTVFALVVTRDRLVHLSEWSQTALNFSRSPAYLSKVINLVCMHICEQFGSLVARLAGFL